MLKPGIHRLDQLRLEHLTSWWGRRKYVAIDLYPEIRGQDADALGQLVLLRFALANGTFKRTYRARFPEFDREVLRAARDAFPPPCRLRVHDLAVSDGRTSVDLFEALGDVYKQGLQYRASDIAPFVYVLRRRGDRLRVAVDDQERLLQIVWPPFVFNVPRPESLRLYPVNHILRRILTATAVRRLLADPRTSDVERTRVDLVHPSCADLVRNDGRFELVQHDITTPAGGPYDVVRAMNILNKDYFDADTLARIVGHLCESVTDGGILITGSNQGPDSPVQGSIFRKCAAGFEELHASAGGSLVRDLISAA